MTVTGLVSGPARSGQRDEFRVLDILVVLAKRKSFIINCFAAGVLLGAATGLLFPKKYQSKAQILPPQQNQSVALSMLNQLGPLAALASKDLGVHNSSDLYVGILHSRTVADNLIQRFSLMKVYHKHTFADARKRLDSATEISAGKEGIISIAVKDHDPDRAANIANGYVEELRQLTKTLAVTEAGMRRLFFEHEVQTAKDDLANAEQALKETQEVTGIIQLDSQSKAMIEAYMTLRAQKAAKEAQIQAMRAFATPENPDLIRAEHELAAFQTELSRFEKGNGAESAGDVPLANVPKAGLEYVRRLREVKYREALLELLTKQYEIARIDEAKDAALIQVLDKAVRPELQIITWPLRILIAVLIAFSLGLLGVLSALFLEALQRNKENPDFAAHIQLLKYHILGRANRGMDVNA